MFFFARERGRRGEERETDRQTERETERDRECVRGEGEAEFENGEKES